MHTFSFGCLHLLQIWKFFRHCKSWHKLNLQLKSCKWREIWILKQVYIPHSQLILKDVCMWKNFCETYPNKIHIHRTCLISCTVHENSFVIVCNKYHNISLVRNLNILRSVGALRGTGYVFGSKQVRWLGPCLGPVTFLGQPTSVGTLHGTV